MFSGGRGVKLRFNKLLGKSKRLSNNYKICYGNNVIRTS